MSYSIFVFLFLLKFINICQQCVMLYDGPCDYTNLCCTEGNCKYDPNNGNINSTSLFRCFKGNGIADGQQCNPTGRGTCKYPYQCHNYTPTGSNVCL